MVVPLPPLTHIFKKLQVVMTKDDEDKVLHVSKKNVNSGQQYLLNSCFGKVFTDNECNLCGLKNILNKS